MCEGCVLDGWMAEGTWKRIKAVEEKWPDSAYGPAHIVIDDCNILDGHISFCLDKARNYCPDDYSCDHSPEELADTIELLEWLLSIPEEER